jgi:carboxyl-terminal processing protease
MPRKLLYTGTLFWVGVLSVLTAPATAQLADRAVETAAVTDVLRHGQQLETERRWGDALAAYEDALRQYPDERSLERRFEYARLHYDLTRRYNDSSFAENMQRLPTGEAFDLYSDVLLKIQAHYVETPDWKALAERGMNDLVVALSEPAFLARHVPPSSLGSVDAFCSELRRTLGERTINSRDDVRDAVATVARLAESRLSIPATPVVLEFTCGAMNSLDPYSSYLTPNQLTEVYSQIEGNFVGLGVELKPQNGELLIVRVIPNSPAQEAGIVAGDLIVAVDGTPTRNYSSDKAANMLQGAAGTSVGLTLVTPGREPRSLFVRRQKVEVPSIDEVRIADSQNGIGYLKLVCFQKNTSHDLDTALWRLHHDGMRSLIVDLRGNPGGLLVSAVEVVNKFIDRGVVVSTRGRNAQEDFTYTARAEAVWQVPLVLIIDQDSASAAEIFAGAIRDHRRGTIVGVRSYGKGSVQGIFPLSYGNSGVRLTTARFYSPAGRPFVRVGVEPDILVHQTAKAALSGVAVMPGQDAMLMAAIQAATPPNLSAAR